MRAILRVPERYAYCIFLSTTLALLPTSFSRVTSKSLDHPPSTSKMILHSLLSYPGYLCFSSHLSGAYFMGFLSRLFTQGQLISRAITCLSLLLTILASNLFALSPLVLSIYRNIPVRLYPAVSYTDCGLTGEYHRGTVSIRH